MARIRENRLGIFFLAVKEPAMILLTLLGIVIFAVAATVAFRRMGVLRIPLTRDQEVEGNR